MMGGAGALAEFVKLLQAAVDMYYHLEYCRCFLDVILSGYGRGVSSRR